MAEILVTSIALKYRVPSSEDHGSVRRSSRNTSTKPAALPTGSPIISGRRPSAAVATATTTIRPRGVRRARTSLPGLIAEQPLQPRGREDGVGAAAELGPDAREEVIKVGGDEAGGLEHCGPDAAEDEGDGEH